MSKKNPPKNINRWMKLIEAQPCVATVLKELPAEALSNISKASSRFVVHFIITIHRNNFKKYLRFQKLEFQHRY